MSVRFSAEWWAHWTAALHRPGRLDDEEIPPELSPHAVPVWTHYPPWHDARGQTSDALDARAGTDGEGPQNRDAAAARPDWPTLRNAQMRCGPAPTDACNVHGRCVGSCER